MSNNTRKVFTYLKSLASLGLVTSLGLSGAASCGSSSSPGATDDMGSASGDMSTGVTPTMPAAIGFSHDGTLTPAGDVFPDGQQIPISQSEITHSCGKITYSTLSRILASRGIKTTPGTLCTDASGTYDCTAGSLYTNGNLVLGIANYPARAPESPWNTTGGIVRLQDIMVAAAEELIPNAAALGTFAAGTPCAGTQLYTVSGTTLTCNPDGFACLLGVPLTPDQLGLCNTMATEPAYTDPMVAKRHTVAAISSTIYLCD